MRDESLEVEAYFIASKIIVLDFARTDAICGEKHNPSFVDEAQGQAIFILKVQTLNILLHLGLCLKDRNDIN